MAGGLVWEYIVPPKKDDSIQYFTIDLSSTINQLLQ